MSWLVVAAIIADFTAFSAECTAESRIMNLIGLWFVSYFARARTNQVDYLYPTNRLGSPKFQHYPGDRSPPRPFVARAIVEFW